MAVTKVVSCGDTQIVEIPREFWLACDEVEVLRNGDELVLRERPVSLRSANQLTCQLPERSPDGIDDLPAQERKEF